MDHCKDLFGADGLQQAKMLPPKMNGLQVLRTAHWLTRLVAMDTVEEKRSLLTRIPRSYHLFMCRLLVDPDYLPRCAAR